jgi:hypothetical protein
MTRRVAIGVVAAALLLMAACGKDKGAAKVGEADQTTTTASTSTTTSTTAPPATTTTIGENTTLGESDATGKSELPDGRHFGYWSTFEIGDTIAFGEFDLAYFLTGKEAEKAAAAHGDEVNNDYYIVNDNPKLRTMIVDGHAAVLVLASEGGPDQKSSNVADFAVDRHKHSGFWITIAGGKVTKIEEQYLP